VLQAPPGAGKTTRVPLALLAEPWLAGRIVMLEPRRLAARAAARYMARLLGEDVGETVGYRVRLDTRIGPRTRVEVVTEGVLTRMLQSDPSLAGVAVVIFDEFHERSVHADLGLALTLHARTLLRDDLRILVMSATLDELPVAALLGAAPARAAPVVSITGEAHPVETHYLERPLERRVEDAVVRTIERVLHSEPGDVLVFLPGAAEIARVEAALRERVLPPTVDLRPLYGNLSADAQDRAIAPSPAGRRKIVLATAIAETSLTIEGVRVVVDAGLMRVPRFSPRTGMTRLATLPVTRASADQRRGRAGRLGPGVCYRLWTEHEHAGRPAHGVPEIRESDLAPLALELAAWGVSEPGELRWLDAPPAAAYAQATELLGALGALDAHGRLTPHGRELHAVPLHPRLAHMLLRARSLDRVALACELAALLGDRDIVRSRGEQADTDVRIRLDALRTDGTPSHVRGHEIDRAALHRARAEAVQLRRHFGRDRRPVHEDDTGDAGLLLAFAYPDRIARRRGEARGRFLLRNGRGAVIGAHETLAGDEFIVAAQLEGGGRESRVFVAGPITLIDIETHFADRIATETSVDWHETLGVRARARDRLGAIVLRERETRNVSDDEAAAALTAELRRRGLEALPWSDSATRLRQRLAFLRALDDAWPDVSDAALLATLEHWLVPRLSGVRTAGDLRALDLSAALADRLDGRQRARLDDLAPTHITVPSGSRIPIRYDDPASPVLAVRLQEVFGWNETPRIAGGRVPLTLHLLSPARRPVQVTRDLASFWEHGYFEVRRDLRGRYPKHYWPADPHTAEPTRRTRPRKQ
jgi:ATP-dependent helicase HrpB